MYKDVYTLHIYRNIYPVYTCTEIYSPYTHVWKCILLTHIYGNIDPLHTRIEITLDTYAKKYIYGLHVKKMYIHGLYVKKYTDYLAGYHCPCVLDVKMGVCTAAPDRPKAKWERCIYKVAATSM